MAKIFISYRRSDSAAISGRIYDRLVAKFRRKNVFKDVDDIPAGVDFGSYIQQSLRECAVVLVVIGPRWLGARADDGSRRLENPADWVRVEIETALALGLTVIPLLVEGFSDDDLTKMIDRGTGFSVPVEAQLDIYLQALLIFFGKVSIYCRMRNIEMTPTFQEYIG